MIRFLVDSSADFEVNELKDMPDMEFVPLTVTLEDTDYKDAIDLGKDQLYEMLDKTEAFPKTAQPSPAAFAEIFEDVKAKGDSIICVLISSALSGTYQSATIAKNMVDYDEIYIIDSLSATAGIRLLIEEGRKLRDTGVSAKEIAAKLEDMKSHITILAAVDTLEFLCRGGRLSRTVAAIGEIANLKPIITVTDGKVDVVGKCLGRVKATSFLLKQLEAKTVDTDCSFYPIYSYGTENIEKLEDKLTKAGYKLSTRQQIGATIGAHVGPGAFGIICITK